ncbi:MAG: carboxypeptidase regulatory-like domain-containing protein [Candidatus Electryonea clarkiae]|nr:carboxypeptidase regulatory-like domain-containing protein [Candidatus Electryonea clarkiae]MDP8286295.1 carboxypeptidase regulatory-like domain-containing protein [Candidatus Electryonea clarkiae]
MRRTWLIMIAIAILSVSTTMVFATGNPERNRTRISKQNLLTEAKNLHENGEQLSNRQQRMLRRSGVIPATTHELDETGGPDDYGYIYIDSNEDDGPTYGWIDVSRTGTEIRDMGDDDYRGLIDLPFDFPYYDDTYDQIYICSNGYLVLGEVEDDWVLGEYENTELPDDEVDFPNNGLYFIWQDLNPEIEGEIYYGEDEDGNWVCQFTSIYDFEERGQVSVEVILFPNGNILFQYDGLTRSFPRTIETIGIENSDGTDGLMVSYENNPASYPHDDLAILFIYPDADPDASITGTVTTEEGEAVWGANVNFGDYEATTNQDGDYSIREINSGVYTVMILTEDFVTYIEDDVVVDPGENVFDFELEYPNADIVGVISDVNTGLAIEFAIVELWQEEAGEEPITTTVTGRDGAYRFPGVMLNPYEIHACALRYQSNLSRLDVVEHGAEYEVDINLFPIDEVTIEEIQTQGEIGSLVITTGIVTQGTNITSTDQTDFYIQDGDYGVKVYSDEPWFMDTEMVRGDEIEIVAEIGLVDGMTSLINWQDFTFITNDNPMPDPLLGTTEELALNAGMEGAFALTAGYLQQNPGEFDDYAVVIDDDSGPVHLIVFDATGLDLSMYSEGDWIYVQGIIYLVEGDVHIVPSEDGDLYQTEKIAPTNLTYEVTDSLTGAIEFGWIHTLEIDAFLEFIIYRDGEEINRTLDPAYLGNIPNLTESGTYCYHVTALFHEGESDVSNEVTIEWVVDNVTGNDLSGVPETWAIESIYPNPFNPSVTTVLAIPTEGDVSVEVFSLLGQSVEVIHRGKMSAGYHQLSWNASAYPTGLYLLKMTSSSGFIGVRKVMYIK